jgi:hypothetical protein
MPLEMISKTMKPIRIEMVHSRMLKVCLSTNVFLLVKPHRFLMLFVAKKCETSFVEAMPTINPRKLPRKLLYRYSASLWRIVLFIRVDLDT